METTILVSDAPLDFAMFFGSAAEEDFAMFSLLATPLDF